jgi:glycosyltransferase involved in cell wall biosynthesis
LEQETGSASLLRRSISLLLACYRLTIALKECKAQVVHAYLPTPSALSAIACLLLRIPVFIVGRRNMAFFHRRGNRVLQWADRFPLRYATAIAGNCEAITKEIVEIDRFPAQRTFTIYNGVDTDRFTAVRNPRLRAELGFPDSGFVFGIVASFHKRKRHIDFVHAAKEISDHIPHARFLMIGEDRGTLREIRQYIEAQSLAGKFVIVAGTAEPEKYYRCMDCYLYLRSRRPFQLNSGSHGFGNPHHRYQRRGHGRDRHTRRIGDSGVSLCPRGGCAFCTPARQRFRFMRTHG